MPILLNGQKLENYNHMVPFVVPNRFRKDGNPSGEVKNTLVSFRLARTVPPKKSKEHALSICPSYMIKANYTFVSPMGEPKEVRYYENSVTQMINNAAVVSHTPNSFTIDNHVITLKLPEQTDKFLFLLNHPACKDAVIYDQSTTEGKERLQYAQSRGTIKFYMDAPNEAGVRQLAPRVAYAKEVLSLSDKNETPNERIEQLYTVLDLPSAIQHISQGEHDFMRNAIVEYAEKNWGTYITKRDSSGLPMFDFVKKVEAYERIAYNETSKVWEWGQDVKFVGNKGKAIMACEPHKKYEALVDKLRLDEEGKQLEEKLMAELKHAQNAQKKKEQVAS